MTASFCGGVVWTATANPFHHQHSLLTCSHLVLTSRSCWYNGAKQGFRARNWDEAKSLLLEARRGAHFAYFHPKSILWCSSLNGSTNSYSSEKLEMIKRRHEFNLASSLNLHQTESDGARVTGHQEEHCLHQRAFYSYCNHDPFCFYTKLYVNNLAKKYRFNRMQNQGQKIFHVSLFLCGSWRAGHIDEMLLK